MLGVRGLYERLELLHKILEAITQEQGLIRFLLIESKAQLLAMESMDKLFESASVCLTCARVYRFLSDIYSLIEDDL